MHLARSRNASHPSHPVTLAQKAASIDMGHIKDKSKGGTVTPDNLGAICTNCNEGLQNIALPKPDRVWLLAQVRRATVDDQRALLHWLNQKVKS